MIACTGPTARPETSTIAYAMFTLAQLSTQRLVSGSNFLTRLTERIPFRALRYTKPRSKAYTAPICHDGVVAKSFSDKVSAVMTLLQPPAASMPSLLPVLSPQAAPFVSQAPTLSPQASTFLPINPNPAFTTSSQTTSPSSRRHSSASLSMSPQLPQRQPRSPSRWHWPDLTRVEIKTPSEPGDFVGLGRMMAFFISTRVRSGQCQRDGERGCR